jgi:hypothetical protein
MTLMSNNDRINEAIAILQTMNCEDCAMAIQDLRDELARVKRIAFDRLELIGTLKHDIAALEDTLEDAGFELVEREDHGGLWGAHCRGEI